MLAAIWLGALPAPGLPPSEQDALSAPQPPATDTAPAPQEPAEEPESAEPAEQSEAEPAHPPLWEWERATGNWFGLRDLAESHGITFEAYYSVDFLTNARGGLSTRDGPKVFALFDASLTLDTEALGLWKGGTFFLDIQDFRGRTPTPRQTGDLLYVNSNDAPERFQFSEYWWEQKWLDGLLRTKLGKQDANADFATNEYGGEFVNAAPYYISNLPMPTYPDPALGAALFVEPAEWLTLGGGVYDGEGYGNQTGFNTAFHGDDTSFTIFEAALKPAFSLGDQQLPGVYRVGGWYHGGENDVYFDDLGGRRRPRVHAGNAGLYCVFNQLVLRERPDDPEDEQGVGVFFQLGWVPSRYNEIGTVYGTGLQWTGPIPARDADVLGVGFFHASLSGRVQALEGRYAESVFETYYKIQIAKFLSIKPDIQIVFDPGGAGRDALVVGARLELDL
jgi:porin